MGSSRQLTGFLFRRYDTKGLFSINVVRYRFNLCCASWCTDLVYETRHLRPRSTSSSEGDLHYQMESDRSGNKQPQHELDFGQRILRFHRTTVGCGTWPVHPHAHQAHRASIQCRLLAWWQILGFGQLRQVCSHLVHPSNILSSAQVDSCSPHIHCFLYSFGIVWPITTQLQRYWWYFRSLLELARWQSRRQCFWWQCKLCNFLLVLSSNYTNLPIFFYRYLYSTCESKCASIILDVSLLVSVLRLFMILKYLY